MEIRLSGCRTGLPSNSTIHEPDNEISSAGVRGFARGLKILMALNSQPRATVLQLSRTTKLPRSTIYRLLDTLVEERFVRQVPGDDHYYLNTKVAELSCGLTLQSLITELAYPVIENLNRAIGWPVLLHGFEGNALTTWQVTRSRHVAANPRIGWSAPILRSSPGRLFYANLPEHQQAEVRSMLATSGKRGAAIESELEGMSRVVNEVRRRGYGFRVEGLVPRTCSFALPITVEGKPEAYITVVFAQPNQTLARATRDYLSVTRDAAETIGKAVIDHSRRLSQLGVCSPSRSAASL
ncbi:helix-turn-helix domain-containing protein [Bradyrhizobium macuxiense]|uniref:helix-turn-helix domain-containing protein n=1 Tax=Bradyrhizobium macuxiense TaxID=1755647 RepID=UPI0009EB87CF|nr:helix-turn-helix domain-containing protein [Bradyrhizobium macuxiense]